MKLTPVLQGEPLVSAVEGGFARKRAPVDGFAVDLGDAVGFLSMKDAETALVDLKLRREKGKRAR